MCENESRDWESAQLQDEKVRPDPVIPNQHHPDFVEAFKRAGEVDDLRKDLQELESARAETVEGFEYREKHVEELKQRISEHEAWFRYQDPPQAEEQKCAHSPEYDFSFFRRGDMWMVDKPGKEIGVKHTKGMGCIHLLLQYTQKDIPASEVHHLGLALTGNSYNPTQRQGNPEEQDQVFESTDTPWQRPRAEKKFSDEDLKIAKKNLKQLENRIANETEEEEKQRLQNEHDKFEKYLKENTTHYTQQDENARTSVQKAIRKAILNVRAACSDEFRKQLSLIKTGHSCGYRGNASWKLFE